MQTHIKVLDHGLVRLVDHMGSDLSVVRAARVSYDADWRDTDGDKDAKLIQYLLANRHTSPFEAVCFTFEVKAPIFVLRQWHRHRTWSYNEISARYAELPEEFYVPELSQITTQHTSNKQMRTDAVNPSAKFMQMYMQKTAMDAFSLYHKMLEHGCPRELARSVLPVSTYSRMFATVDLHNLLHFLRLRLHRHAQYEIRVYAQALLDLVTPVVPNVIKAFRLQLEHEGILNGS